MIRDKGRKKKKSRVTHHLLRISAVPKCIFLSYRREECQCHQIEAAWRAKTLFLSDHRRPSSILLCQLRKRILSWDSGKWKTSYKCKIISRVPESQLHHLDGSSHWPRTPHSHFLEPGMAPPQKSIFWLKRETHHENGLKSASWAVHEE